MSDALVKRGQRWRKCRIVARYVRPIALRVAIGKKIWVVSPDEVTTEAEVFLSRCPQFEAVLRRWKHGQRSYKTLAEGTNWPAGAVFWKIHKAKRLGIIAE